VFDYFTMLSLEVESTYGGQVNPSEIGYSPDDRANLPKLGYSRDGPLNYHNSTYGSCLGISV